MNLFDQSQDDDILEITRALLTGESDPIANAANLTALLFSRLPQLNWLGFYFARKNDLVLGPFQGQPACTRIALNRGVCGAAFSQNTTMVVPDVHAFPGHIVCDSASLSEIVVPFFVQGVISGVLDVDSPVHDRFSETDRVFFEAVVQIYVDSLQNQSGK